MVSSIARFDTWQAADGTNVARYNAGQLEVWDGSAWGPTGRLTNSDVSATTGSPTVTNPDGDTCYQFTGDGSITFDKAGYVWAVVVGAGGGGGRQIAGGGGAGGYVENERLWVEPGTYTITVGAGAAGATGIEWKPFGGSSKFHNLTGVGGAPATAYVYGNAYLALSAVQGGSGGGGAYSEKLPNYGIIGQGFNGGAGYGGGAPNECAGGGGGASEVGTGGASGPIGGNGGDGIASTITGTSIYRAGGGGGGSYNGTAGTGGLGGGGNGSTSSATGGAGTANTGGGGGGGGFSGGAGGNGGAGGSGIVIVRVA